MIINGQCKFVMGAMLGFIWCVWTVEDLQHPYRFIAKFFLSLYGVLIIALIDQGIENRRARREPKS